MELMCGKGIYPYEYMTGVERLRERSLPPKEEFASLLNEGTATTDAIILPSQISEGDYQHTQKVFKTFGSEDLAGYTVLYCKQDVLLLADVFENFIDVCLEKYGLDSSHYITAPALSWDAMLKKTGVKAELLTDRDRHLFFEEGIRGGISTITNRYAKANNPYMGEDFNPEEETTYLQYLDANNLYGWAMSQPLPIRNFRWFDEDDIRTYMKYPEWIKNCTLEVDLEYPRELHDAHSDYPLAPESLTVGGTKKLIPNLRSKEKYVLHHKNLHQYLKHGMKLTKIHRGVAYSESMFLKEYISNNTES